MGIKAPAVKGDQWFNTDPLNWEKLRGKVVLVDFWDYTCVNCLRTLPYLNEWYDRYSKYGLVIIGVHAPEFQFAHDPDEVRRAIERLGIQFPVVLDNNFAVWSAYANRYWPHKYLINKDGYQVYDHVGEGGYGEMESRIQQLLKDLNPALDLPPIMEPVQETGVPGAVCFPTTPELYCGYSRGRMGSSPAYILDQPAEYKIPSELEDGLIYLQGQWTAAPEFVKHDRSTADLEDYLAVKYHAAEVNLVMRPGREEKTSPQIVFVKQDDRFLTMDIAGEDIKFRPDGKSYVVVDQPRMYRILKSKDFGEHTLCLFSKDAGVEMYAFTFGSCLMPDEVETANQPR